MQRQLILKKRSLSLILQKNKRKEKQTSNVVRLIFFADFDLIPDIALESLLLNLNSVYCI